MSPKHEHLSDALFKPFYRSTVFILSYHSILAFEQHNLKLNVTTASVCRHSSDSVHHNSQVVALKTTKVINRVKTSQFVIV